MSIKFKIKNKKIARKKEIKKWMALIEKLPRLDKLQEDCMVYGCDIHNPTILAKLNYIYEQ